MTTRRCEQCHHETSGFLRMTKRLDGVLVLACEDCALGLEREKDEAYELLDPDTHCQKHGKEKPMGPYGHRYGGCSDCEPPEPDGEAFRGGEAAAYEAEQMAHIQRTLK